MAAQPLLSLIIPVYNEADGIVPLLKEVASVIVPAIGAIEIIVVDDGSTDQTPSGLTKWQKQPGFRVLRHQQNCGQSAALWTGIQHAKADWLAFLDGDGQNDPRDIVEFWRLKDSFSEKECPDLICGTRLNRQDSLIKRISSRVANTARQFVLKDQTPDSGCGLKLARRKMMLKIPCFKNMHRFYPALFLNMGGRVLSHPVNHRSRQAGQSKYGTWDRLWAGLFDLMGVTWLMRRQCSPALEAED